MPPPPPPPPPGPPAPPPAPPYPQGTRVQTPDGSIYLVLDGEYRHIASMAVYEGMYGGSRDWVSNNSVAGYATGIWINADPPLIQGSDGTAAIFLVDHGSKRWISSWDTFLTTFKFDPSRVVKLDVTQYPEGPSIFSTYPH